MTAPAHSILLLNHNWLAGDLRALGHNVISVGLQTPHLDRSIESGPVSIDFLLSQICDWANPDRIVYYDDSGLPWITGLEYCSIPKLFLSIDSHHHSRWHGPFSALFDTVFVSHLDHLDEFRKFNENAVWFPLWATDIPELPEERTIDCCFRGSMNVEIHPGRQVFFDNLNKLTPVDARPGPWKEAYPQAKIVVNQAVSSDLNFRVFEALASGAMLLTPRIENGLLQLFNEDQDLVLFNPGDIYDAAEKIKLLLADDNRRQAIAESGRNKVLADHTNSSRAKMLESTLSGLESGPVDGFKTDRRNAEAVLENAVITYLFTALARRELGFPVSQILADAAAQSMLNLLKLTVSGANPSEDKLVSLIRIASMLDAADAPEKALKLLTETESYFPDSRLLDLLIIERLIKAGSIESAGERAKQIGLPAKNLQEAVAVLVADLRESIDIRW